MGQIISDYNRSSADDGMEELMEPDLAGTGHMKFVDNRCACCPYGYHIDIDFLRYLESLGKSTDNAADLQEIYNNEHKLRLSMEMFMRGEALEGLLK